MSQVTSVDAEVAGCPNDIVPGIYRHFKGYLYRVFGTASCADENVYVVYEDENGFMWVRPLNAVAAGGRAAGQNLSVQLRED